MNNKEQNQNTFFAMYFLIMVIFAIPINILATLFFKNWIALFVVFPLATVYAVLLLHHVYKCFNHE